MTAPHIQRYYMSWDGSVAPSGSDFGQWVLYDDHARDISAALARASNAAAAMARTLSEDEAEIAAPLRKLLAAMTDRAEKAEAKAGDPLPMTWAEGLIRYLPVTHDGRNSWLINYGHGPDVEYMRDLHPTYRKNEIKASLPPEGDTQ